MRPEILYPLFAPVTALPGVGARVAKLIEKVAGPLVVDLCWHIPTGLIDRRFRPKVSEAEPGRIATLTLQVEAHLPPSARRFPYRVRCADETGFLHLVFFHARPDYLMKLLPPGSTRIVSGTLETFHGERQITHPDHVVPPEEFDERMTVEPVYPLTAGLSPKVLRRAIMAAIDRAPELPEWIDGSIRSGRRWPSWREALSRVHAPNSSDDLLPESSARMRLAFDELVASQLALAIIRARQRRQAARAFPSGGRLRQAAEAVLPFQLTRSQRQALAEFAGDLASGKRMLRLLQGDVGSGKTVVAFLAMADVIEAGAQAALMAPTEILARQHLFTIERLASAVGIEVALLTGREKGKSRREILARIADGSARVVVGTHALFQDEVVFHDLALAVVDEQHRFGVDQRVRLAEKGQRTHVLVMTATPIPRTLTLTAYGDLDHSALREKPAGRQPIDTRTIPLSRIEEVVASLSRALESGARVYWVCPLVEESEQVDAAAAEARYRDLAARFPGRVGLVHGRLKAAEKDAVMAAFAAGEIEILVSTTVIEVGVDVPEATVMVIEHAERFGLAQLHQLRGRVGRGAWRSTCLLLYAAPLNDTARARLDTMRRTDDGFTIAEEDLRLRGAGEVLGTRQSGLPAMRLADLTHHADLLADAQQFAKLVLERDPDLTSPQGEALKTLLYLFGRDAAIRYIRSG